MLSSLWWVFFMRAVTSNGASTALWLSRRNFWSSRTLLCISVPVLWASALGWIVAILSLPRSFRGKNGFGKWGTGWSSLSKLMFMLITDFSYAILEIKLLRYGWNREEKNSVIHKNYTEMRNIWCSVPQNKSKSKTVKQCKTVTCHPSIVTLPCTGKTKYWKTLSWTNKH